LHAPGYGILVTVIAIQLIKTKEKEEGNG